MLLFFKVNSWAFHTAQNKYNSELQALKKQNLSYLLVSNKAVKLTGLTVILRNYTVKNLWVQSYAVCKLPLNDLE